MNNILPFSGGGGSMGSGPDDPMLLFRVSRLEEDVKDVKSKPTSIESSLTKIDGRLSGIEGRLSGIEGRFGAVDARFASLPTTWTMLTIIFATWGIGSSILIFALNVLRK